MGLFTYEDQGEKRYLVYEKRAEDSLDSFTLEMMSNNRIEGVVPSNGVRIDDKFYMKYDITGKQNLREYLGGVVNRKKILGVLESVTDAAMAAEEYMLNFSSYVLESEYMYVEPDSLKVCMIVLPITRDEEGADVFFKKLLADIRYDQAEDCRYVAALLNLLGDLEPFSFSAFKRQIEQLKKEEAKTACVQEEPLPPVKPEQQPPQEPLRQELPSWHLPQQGLSADSQHMENKYYISEEDRKKIVHDIIREKNLETLFSKEDEKQAKKEKRGFFFIKEKPEKIEQEKKPEKKRFWEKLAESKKKAAEKDLSAEPILGGFAIPEKDGKETYSGFPGEKDIFSLHKEIQEGQIAIPAQDVRIDRKPVDVQDFGETVFIGGDGDEETFLIGEGQEVKKQEYVLYRRRTKESFRICEEVTRIGRSPGVTEICISGNRGVGRIHAILYLQGGQVFIEDNHSKNKTFVDGAPLDPGQSPRKLTDGAKISLGDEELEFHIQK